MIKPIVSIITPCYNAQSTIAQTIESVINQTYSDWEMLIIDDCSTDKSVEIINHYISNDNRIKYFTTSAPSGAPSLPRNIGLINAKGDYIAFLDADDIWLPEKLAEQIDFISKNNYSFVYSDYEKISWDGTRNNRKIKLRNISSFWDTLESCSIPCLTVVIKRSIIGNLLFQTVPKEDFVFWLDVLKRNIKAYNTGKIHALYREQKKSRSSNKFKMINQQWYILRKIEGIKPIIALLFMCKFLYIGFLKFLK